MQKFRLIVLVGCFSGIISTIIATKVLSASSAFRFSEDIPLITSKLTSSKKLENITKLPIPIYGWQYEYDFQGKNLTVQAYYLPNSDGNIFGLLKEIKKFDLSPSQIEEIDSQELGSYGRFIYEDKAYLATCLHFEGKGAFTAQQFSQLVNKDINSRIFPWILGLKDLRDWRCLWVNMSIPLNDITKEEAYTILDENWKNWHQSWIKHS